MVYITACFVTEQEVRQLTVLCGGQSVYTHTYTCLVVFRSAIIVAPHINYTLGPHAHVQSTPHVHGFHRRLQLCRQWVQQHIGQGRRLPELMGQKERPLEWLIAGKRVIKQQEVDGCCSQRLVITCEWGAECNCPTLSKASCEASLHSRPCIHYLPCITPLKGWEWIMLIKSVIILFCIMAS